ncbi:universal stress protein [Halococcus agarilyticus]|uniref:universal stress protein n=1 Tax=Halococcus agarilyticus TaxID=1232219 RepID=UPI0006776B5D|nr:universal stress protein [Halococcus agarilyticus]
MYERILVPTDGREHSSAAVRHAVDIAGKYGATVHAVFVIDTDTGWLTVSKADVHDALREVGQDASEQALREVETAAADAGVELVTDVLEGTPGERILAYAAENDVDLVVMGTHGHSGIERRLLGSVTQHVAGAAQVPVMTVSAPAENVT